MLERSGTRWHLRPDEVGILHCRPQTVGPHIQRPLGPYWYVSSKFSLICVSNRQNTQGHTEGGNFRIQCLISFLPLTLTMYARLSPRAAQRLTFTGGN